MVVDNLSNYYLKNNLVLGEFSNTTMTFEIPNINDYDFIGFNVAQDIHYITSGYPIMNFFSHTRRKKFSFSIKTYKDIEVKVIIDLTVPQKLTLSIDKQIQYANVFGISELCLIKL